MKIGSCISAKGKIESGFLKVSYLNKSTKLPIKIIEGKEKGKTALVCAGMHGDELNGINIVSKFVDKINPETLCGRIIVVPVLNTIGFYHGERKVRYDDKDLNRCFSSPVNSFTTQLAKTFLEKIVAICDFGIDFHDSNKRYILLPHTRIFEKEYKEVNELSRKFGTEIVMKRDAKRGILALESIKQHNTPILTVEIGGGMSVLPKYLNEGIRGLNNILISKGFIEGEISLPQKQFILSDRLGYNSKIQGILNITKKLGNTIEKEEIIADVTNPLKEKKINMLAKDPGILFSIKASSHIKTNERAFSLLHLKEYRNQIIPSDGKVVENKENYNTNIYTGAFNNAMDTMKKHSKNFFEALLKE
jgi:uncharacterized protein